ncbi:GNAT family N-acetyltransferase [Actinomadura hibisca]|uniref:GNAT family N-acetyltransferase n=1 Tax=Actinomadura hibisca TaxID=68565 RepID=UPI00082DC76F|nr:GNAT family N-acetyltransferase [Actinomadura hibisca]
MAVTIRAAADQDTEAIAALLVELNAFYGDDTVETSDEQVRQVHDALFNESSSASALLAFDTDTLVGMASYSVMWPAAGLSTSLYLKELYVARSYQRQGIGASLMKALRDEALRQNCSRVEWTTDDDNPDAIEFYEALGMKPRPSKIFYRMEL